MTERGGGEDISREGESVLRVLFRYRGQVAGHELMERLFATTSEIPLEPADVCRAIRELVARGYVAVDTGSAPDPGFDFSVAAITEPGRRYLTS